VFGSGLMTATNPPIEADGRSRARPDA